MMLIGIKPVESKGNYTCSITLPDKSVDETIT